MSYWGKIVRGGTEIEFDTLEMMEADLENIAEEIPIPFEGVDIISEELGQSIKRFSITFTFIDDDVDKASKKYWDLFALVGMGVIVTLYVTFTDTTRNWNGVVKRLRGSFISGYENVVRASFEFVVEDVA